MESLENRIMLAVTCSLDDGNLLIEGNEEADFAMVQRVTSASPWFFMDEVWVTADGRRERFNTADVERMTFRGHGGHDTFYNLTHLPSAIVGGAGNDTLCGGSGADRLYGNSGNDILDGGSGHDRLDGGANDDILVGRHGNDTLIGRSGRDSLDGDWGRDALFGGSGADFLDGGSEGDRIHGGSGVDHLRGGTGDDYLRGGTDNDRLWGDAGDDTIHGDAGDDQLYGGAGGDSLYGGNDDDTLVSIDGSTADILYGQSGFDSFWVDENRLGRWIFSDEIRDASRSENATNVHRVRGFSNGVDRTLDGDAVADPSDGEFYKNFAGNRLFPSTGPSANDLGENHHGVCWLLAALGATAEANQNAIRQTVVSLGDATYAVHLDGQYYRVDADLPTESLSSWELTCAGFGTGESIWTGIVEKAYACHKDGSNTYSSLRGGWSRDAFRALHATDVGDRYFDTYRDGEEILTDIADRLARGQVLTLGFDRDVPAHILAGHEYIVGGVNTDEHGNLVSVTLYNPGTPIGEFPRIVTADELFASIGSITWANVG